MCGAVLGWKYVGAEEDSQKYKVGKFILETRRVVRAVRWDGAVDGCEEEGEDDDGERAAAGGAADADVVEAGGVQSSVELAAAAVDDGDDIQFDSQDEDECEDLFAGVWSPQLAARRRRLRGFGARATA